MEFFELKPGHVVRLGSVIGVEVNLDGAYKNNKPHLHIVLTQGGAKHSMLVDFSSRDAAQAAAESLCEKLFQREGQTCLAREADRRDLFVAAALEGLLARDRWNQTALISLALEIADRTLLMLNSNERSQTSTDAKQT